MNGRKAGAEQETSGRRGSLRWARVATLAAVLLIHLGFLAFLLAPPPGWRWFDAKRPPASSDALLVHLLPMQVRTIEPPPAAPLVPHQAHNVPSPHRSPPLALSSRPAAQPAPPVPQAAPRSIDSLIVTAPPSYVAGGGRLSGSDYGQQNVRVPGSSEPVRGMPVFRMADPRMQGVAGVVRFIGHLTGAVDPHCLKLDAAGSMTTRERLANHVDDAQMEAIVAHYGCPDPLKPGAAMYYRNH